MITTVTLSRGALRLAARRVVVKRLSAIHDLGAMDVFCTDKTGTLTEARIALVSHLATDGGESPRIAALAAINAQFKSGASSALDDAILEAARADPACVRVMAAAARLDALPFDFERRLASVLVETDGRRLLIVKGAPEAVLARATRVEQSDGAILVLEGDARARAEAQVADLSRKGLRLLAVGSRRRRPRAMRLRKTTRLSSFSLDFACFSIRRNIRRAWASRGWRRRAYVRRSSLATRRR